MQQPPSTPPPFPRLNTPGRKQRDGHHGHCCPPLCSCFTPMKPIPAVIVYPLQQPCSQGVALLMLINRFTPIYRLVSKVYAVHLAEVRLLTIQLPHSSIFSR